MNAGWSRPTTGPARWLENPGPNKVPSANQPAATGSQLIARSVSRGPRESWSNTRWYSRWTAVATAIRATMKNTHDRPLTALEVADEEVNKCPTSELHKSAVRGGRHERVTSRNMHRTVSGEAEAMA